MIGNIPKEGAVELHYSKMNRFEPVCTVVIHALSSIPAIPGGGRDEFLLSREFFQQVLVAHRCPVLPQ